MASAAETGKSEASTPAAAVVVDARLAELGRHLFFDTRLSNDWSNTCARCHNPAEGWSSRVALSRGYTNSDYFRNATSLVGVTERRRFMWDGRIEGGVGEAVRVMIRGPEFMHSDPLLVVERLRRVPEYMALWQAARGAKEVFDEPGMIDAMVEFLKTAQGESAKLDLAARQGQELFSGKAGCSQCHRGSALSDAQFHRLGVPENPAILREPLRTVSLLRYLDAAGGATVMKERADPGRFAVSHREEDRGRFLTPSLWGVAASAPYMHNGMFKTLEDVVEFYDGGGGTGSELRPLGLSRSEKRALVAYLSRLGVRGPAVVEPPQPLMRPRDYATRDLNLPAASAQPATTNAMLAPLPPPPIPADNPSTPEKIELGKLLFWDPRVGGNGSTPCVSCHFPESGWGDGNAISRGYPGTQNLRNAQTVLNAAYYARPFWEGAVDRLEAQAQAAGTGIVEGNADPSTVQMRLALVPEYVRRFKAVFGTEWPQAADVWRAIAAFVRTVVSDTSQVPFDRYLAGEEKALSASALRGYELFKGKAGCLQCHDGALASDQQYHSLGLPENDILRSGVLYQVTHDFAQRAKGVTDPRLASADLDLGRYYQTKDPRDIGKFRTPSLRELKYTAPYMHNGQFASLAEVVEFFDRGGGPGPNKSLRLKPLGLSDQEKKDLVAFLESLSMERPLLMTPPKLPRTEALR